ncbi:hypothetical protein BHM03_00038560 [Ensete ventricosum]|nr:hypothetical protein BHM03_00038560 [Ensete ventricosum]
MEEEEEASDGVEGLVRRGLLFSRYPSVDAPRSDRRHLVRPSTLLHPMLLDVTHGRARSLDRWIDDSAHKLKSALPPASVGEYSGKTSNRKV